MSLSDPSIADFTAPPAFLRKMEEPPETRTAPGLASLPDLEALMEQSKRRTEGERRSEGDGGRLVAASGSTGWILKDGKLLEARRDRRGWILIRDGRKLDVGPLFGQPPQWKVEVKGWN